MVMALVGMRCSRTLEIVYSSAVLGAHFAYRAVTYRTPIPESRPCLTRNSGRPAAPSTPRGLTARPGPAPPARPGRPARPDSDDEDRPPWARLPPIRPARPPPPAARPGGPVGQ